MQPQQKRTPEISTPRILVDALQLGNRSGTGTYVQNLLNGLANAGAEVTALTDEVRADLSVPAVVAQHPLLTKLLRRPFAVSRAARKTGAEVLHFPANFGTWDRIPGNRSFSIVTTIHDLTYLRNPDWYPRARAELYRHLIHRTVGQTDRFLTDSKQSAEDMQTYLHVPADQIDVVPLGVSEAFRPAEPDAVSELRRRLRLPDQYSLFVGTIEPRKNLVRVVQAFERIAGRMPDMHLVIAGRMGWKTATLLRMLAESPVRNRIHLTDYVPPDDLPLIYAAAKVFIWPSLWEGFGLPVLEAMACGAPVITSDSGSLAELCGDAAMRVDPEDIDAIGNAWLRVAHEEALRQSLTERGVKRAAGFSWHNCVEKTLVSYRKAIETRR